MVSGCQRMRAALQQPACMVLHSILNPPSDQAWTDIAPTPEPQADRTQWASDAPLEANARLRTQIIAQGWG